MEWKDDGAFQIANKRQMAVYKYIKNCPFGLDVQFLPILST